LLSNRIIIPLPSASLRLQDNKEDILKQIAEASANPPAEEEEEEVFEYPEGVMTEEERNERDEAFLERDLQGAIERESQLQQAGEGINTASDPNTDPFDPQSQVLDDANVVFDGEGAAGFGTGEGDSRFMIQMHIQMHVCA
jgi:hypothetical protein